MNTAKKGKQFESLSKPKDSTKILIETSSVIESYANQAESKTSPIYYLTI